MKKKISVIVPVYNAEAFLPACIDSVLGQHCDGLELILVDDGSSDASGDICGRYAAKWDQIRYVRQENSGASAARNEGLLRASGDYIVFVDADDYLPAEDVVSRMAAQMEETGADILVGDYCRLWDGRLLPAGSCGRFGSLPAGDRAFRFQGFFSVGTLSYIWGKMYRRAFLEQNQLSFSAYRYGEDKLFNFECYIRGAVYTFLEHPVYVYRKNDDSVSYAFRRDSVDGWMGIAEQTEQLLREEGREEECGDLVACTIFFAAFFDGKMNYTYNGRSLSAIKRVLKEYGSYELAARCFAEMSRGRRMRGLCPLLWRVMIRGFAFGMRLHCYSALAFGIKLLVDLRVDERLSDTGLRGEDGGPGAGDKQFSAPR